MSFELATLEIACPWSHMLYFQESAHQVNMDLGPGVRGQWRAGF